MVIASIELVHCVRMLYPISVPKPGTAEDLVGFIDRQGHTIIQPVYLGGSHFHEGKASVVDTSGKSGFTDDVGTLAIACRFQGLGNFKCGLCSINGGFIDHS